MFTPSTDPVWVSSQRTGEVPERRSYIGIGAIGVTAGTLGLFGHSVVRGKSLWDWTGKGLRSAEYLTPGFIGRTFRLGEIVSPFETAKAFAWQPHHFKGGVFSQYISKITGLSSEELAGLDVFKTGLSFTPGKNNIGILTSGSGKLIKSNASLLRYESIGPSLGNWYARTFGLEFGETLFGERAKEFRAPSFIPIEAVSSNTRSRVRYAQGIAAQIVGRFNKLLASPFEGEFLEPYIGPLVKKFPILERLNFSVKPGTASQMLGRYTLRGAGLLGAVGLLSWADYRRRQNNSLLAIPEFALYGALGAAALAPRNAKSLGKYAAIGGLLGGVIGGFPAFNRGLYSGLGSIWAGANLSRAAVSDALGLTEAVKSQEQYLPQSTRFTTLLGFTGVGALYAGFAQYGRRLNLTRRLVGRGHSIPEASKLATRFLELLPKQQAARTAAWAIRRGFNQPIQRLVSSLAGTSWYQRGALVTGALSTSFGLLGAISSGSPLSAATYIAGGALSLYGVAKDSKILAGAGILLPYLLRSNKSASELADEYSGRTEVPVMKSRWWSSNRTPWEGTRPLYYRKHWVAGAGDAAKEIALYGSEEAYWDTQNPINYLVDPYAQEKLMWKQGYRFPVTGQAFDETPVLGPLLSETIGQLVKPRRLMAPEAWTTEGKFGEIGPSYLYQPGPTSERGIIPSLSGYPDVKQQGLGFGLSYQEHLLKEVVGLPGFVTESVQAALFGSKLVGGEDRTYLASATQLSGVNKAYWDLNLGGLGELSEPIRRFIAKDPGFDYYNPFKTKMPAWLPGDKGGYFLNFKSAEIFTQLQEPWKRLPGPGFLAANPEWAEEGILNEDTPLGQWPVSARYEVAGDVAPWGRGTAGIRAHLTRIMRTDPESLTPFEYRKIRETDEQVEAIKTKRKFNPYVTSKDGLEKLELKVLGVSPGGLIQTDIGPLSLAGVSMTGAQLSEQAIRENNSITIQEAERRASLRSRDIGAYVQSNLSKGDSITAYVNKFIGSRYLSESSGVTVPAVVYSGGDSLNQGLLDAGLTSSSLDVNKDPLAFRGVYGDRTPLRHAWDLITHAMDTPLEALTPAAPAAKFIHRQTAIEDYERNQLYGREIALWQRPIEHFIKPFVSRSLMELGFDETPANKQKQRDIDEYFDRLKYLKYAALADTTTDPKARSEFKRQMSRTLTGINPFSPYIFSKSAFPADVRPYVDSFLEEKDPTERQRILSRVSPLVGRAIAGKWEAQELEGLKRKREVAGLQPNEQSRLSDLERRSFEETVHGEQSRITEVNEYFKTHKLPRPNFIGFHPQADLEDFKLSYVEQEGLDQHDFGLWEEQRRSLLRKPFVAEETDQIDPFASELNFGNPYQDLRDSLRDSAHSGMRIEYGSSAHQMSDVTVHTEEDIDQSLVHSVYEGLS